MKRWAAYVMVVLVAAGSSWFFAKQAVKDTATIAYWNAIDGCIRGNYTVREPLHDFFSVFYADESKEHDDPEVTVAARVARNRTVTQQCLEVIARVGDAADYVPPEER